LLNVSFYLIFDLLEIYRIMSKKTMNTDGNRSGAVPQGKKIAVDHSNVKKGEQGKSAKPQGGGCC
jgi:hypothetical protein